MQLPRNPTRAVRVGSVTLGGGHPIVVQSMCATKTTDVEATAARANALFEAGAGVVRIAVDSRRDAAALAAIRQRTRANLSVDLQENYRLASEVAPWVHKIRYNPGHLYHHERNRPWQDKVRFLVNVAVEHDCACASGSTAARWIRQNGRSMPPRTRSARCWKSPWSIVRSWIPWSFAAIASR